MNTSTGKAEKHTIINLASLNLEGRGNSLYLSKMEPLYDIICIQEHWMFEFQKQSLSEVLSNMELAIRCCDTFEDISNFNLPRGKGGVAIAWKKHLSHHINVLPEGNERILAIEMKPPHNICIVCVYMPVNNSGNSHTEYMECLDILSTMLSKYSCTHKIILAGDFNGTLLKPRNYNKHDKLLQAFIRENKLHSNIIQQPTFYHHSGKSTSQIDYIIHNVQKDFLFEYKIGTRTDSNTSSHVPVSAKFAINTRMESNKTVQNKIRKQKPIWEKIDQISFSNLITEKLQKYPIHKSSPEEALQYLCDCIQKATINAVPMRISNVKGPKWKASPIVLELLDISKSKHKIWAANGRQDDNLKVDKILAQRNLRRQLRREQYVERDNFYSELMEKPDTTMFHKLIRRNRSNHKRDSMYHRE